MKKYEYKAFSTKDGFTVKALNECGAEGWRLVSVIELSDKAIFVREVAGGGEKEDKSLGEALRNE